MGHRVARAAGWFIAALALAGCAVTEARRQQDREALSRRISDDAIAYNEAYSAAISGQILLNILRAYNRQPRQYMSMSGFSNAAPDSRTGSVGVSDLPLGRLGQEWGGGAFSIESASTLEPEYKVEPFDTTAYSNIALRPTPDTVFRRYWETGWNRDMLLILLVDRMEITPLGSAPRQTLYNSAATISQNCQGPLYERPSVEGGCAFVRRVREMSAQLKEFPQTAPVARRGTCQPVAIYENPATRAQDERLRRQARAVRPGADGACPVALMIGATRYTLHLRSLDDMVYYLGELLRRDQLEPNQPPTDTFVARLDIVAPGTREQFSPLLRIVPATRETEREYTATVTYVGRRYSAGQSASRFCYDPTPQRRCEGAAPGDRTATVLEFLIGVLAHNQSAAAVSAPEARR
ncbi:MAG: hypothetical protein ABL864_11880 [Terricaulis sp.]